MKKVFISHAHQDDAFARQLAEGLKSVGIEVWVDEFALRVGDNLIEKINEGLSKCDHLIVIMSKAYFESSWTRHEFSAFAAREMAGKSNPILPVLIEDCDIPVFLRDRVYLDFRTSFEEPFQRMVSFFTGEKEPPTTTTELAHIAQNQSDSALSYQVSRLREHLQRGEMTLFCGAGISLGAGVPAWSNLLSDLLAGMFGKQLPKVKQDLAELYQSHFSPSPLIMAQYLKNGLGDDFLTYVRTSLYKEKPTTSSLIDAVVELCRPQRSRASLNSIVTFNFDDLLEHNLQENHIHYHSVFAEGQRPKRSEIPIYHVHGYLPRSGDLTEDNDIVFSEDAYHSQFIDSFSWSNLVQLNHLSQNVCVFVGLSMTDPNLRRLLDVAMRKTPDRKANHYVFRKKCDRKRVGDVLSPKTGHSKRAADIADFARIVELLEDQDSRNLGLNVIWVDEYTDIPKILRRIAEEI
ncbi:MAG: TIR domain-containing protein [Deltaproteobacteria bacterium]|nr:TIR domain-containing protein [Deltaproteobacteria bacterium]